MAAIKDSLEQSLFRPNEEALYSVISVSKQGAGKKKKSTFLCAVVTTKDKPFQVRIYKVQKSEKDVYKKKQCWKLSDLKIVDGKDDSKDKLIFDLHFEKVYQWVANRIVEKNDFIETIWRLSNRYGGNKKPIFHDVNQRILTDDTDQLQAALKGSIAAGNQEGQEDYQRLTPKEENDLNAMLSKFEDALTNVEGFTDQLSSELQELEYVNITSLMGSEQQAKDLLSLIDKSVEELNVLDDRLCSYDDSLKKVSDQMGQMEFKDNRMEVERANNKQLLEEIKYIVGKLDISQRHICALEEGDLYNRLGITECISAAKILLDAFNTPFKPGIGELRAVTEQLHNIENHKSAFAQRFYLHLDKFISQHSNIDIVSYKPTNELSLPSHDAVHDDFVAYVELMKWLKELDHSKYTEIKNHYEDSFKVCYEKEFKEYLEFAKQKASSKVKGSKSNHSIRGNHSTEHLPSKSKNPSISRLKRGKDSKLKRSPSKESIDSMASIESSTSSATFITNTATHFDQVFDIVLSELEPYVAAEQDFCAMFFHLRYPGDGKEQEQNNVLPDNIDGAMMSRSKLGHGKTVDEVRDMMEKLMGFLNVEMQNFISFGESLHPHNVLYAMYRINNQKTHLVNSHVSGAPPTFLGTLFAGWLVHTKRLFDRCIDNLCRQIEEVKSKKKKVGILYDVLTVEKFFKSSENIFRGSERRGEIDKAYQKLIATLFQKIEEVAEENDKPPPEIVMFENYHYVHSLVRGLKNPNLDNEKKLAEQKYYDAMHQYIATRLGRPLDRMSRFFQRVESCINSGVRMEDIGYQIAFNQQELKNVIKEYPAKEVKKGLEVLYKKIEKYVTEAGLIQVLWHNLQEAFVRQFERYEELVKLCYPNSNVHLSVSINEILEFFSNIAQSN